MDLKSNIVEVHICKRTKKGIEFLLLKRNESEVYPNIWQMVSGKIKTGEKVYETAVREVTEETGLCIEKLWTVPNINSYYSPEDDSIIMIPVFLVEVNKNTGVLLSKEHSDYQWVGKSKAKELLIWEGQRNSVNLIYQYLQNEGDTLNFNEISINSDK